MRNKVLDVAIIDYKISNMYSVQSACNFIGLHSEITNNADEILTAHAAILPGVGSFGAAMDHLKELGLIQVIKEFIASGKPFMGICLGMQLLLSESEEFGIKNGLNIIPGYVRKFPEINIQGKKIKVPYIGWNHINIVNTNFSNDWSVSPLNEISNEEFMYFVHSYYVIPDDSNVTLTLTDYEDIKYCSSLAYKNIFACQFHPEKSGNKGLQIFKNFLATIKKRGY